MPIEKTCEHCGTAFKVQPKYAHRKYCGTACHRAHELEYGRPAARKTPINFTCQECSKPFVMMKAYLAAYQKRFGKDPMYCSRQCSAEGRRKTADSKNFFTCEQCGKTQPLKRGPDGNFYYEQKYCDVKCKADSQKTRALDRFNSGDIKRHFKRHGYVYISVPSLVTGKKHAIFEHRYVMSKHLERELRPEETVHHKDGNRANNALENLELFSSNHGPGQRVVDKVQFAIEILTLYPEFARQAGYALHKVDHAVTGEPLALPQ